MENEVRLIDVRMMENDVSANTVGEFFKTLLLQLWKEAEMFSAKRPFGNSDWQYQVYASLINAGYEIGELDEDGYIQSLDYQKADKLIENAIFAVFAGTETMRPKGRWELHGNDDDCGCSYFCSNCHRSYPEEWFYDHGRYAPFENCPHCTAKMEG